MIRTEFDPPSMPLDQLRAMRAGLQHDDDAVSYVRRMAQARIDLVRAEQRRRSSGEGGSITAALPGILAGHLSGGAPRPPRPADDFSGHPLAAALDDLGTEMGSDVLSMDDGSLERFAEALQEFEQQRSQERQELFGRIDELSAELVRRYRDGEADVEGLMAD